jgi:lysophospholipase L1-like esterase
VRDRIAHRYGFSRPYRPERILTLACAVALLLVSLAGFVALAMLDGFAVPSPRADYVLYLLALMLLGAVLAPWPRLAAVPLILASIDLGLGIGSFSLQRWGVESILPPSHYPASGFRWHPLLQATPLPSLMGGYPGVKITHSREGTRGRDYAAEELAHKTVIAVFGGSTTYDIGVSDGETWAEQLEQGLGTDAYAVVNHGVLGYTTVENLISTAFYQSKFGMPPRCAVYYVGWNDLRNAHIRDLDAGYADYHLRTQIDSLKARRIGVDFLTPSPLATLLMRAGALAVDTVRPAPSLPAEFHAKPDPVLDNLFVRNVAAISAINRERGIRTFWVGQLVNVAEMASVEEARWTPHIRGRDLWPLLEHLNGMLRSTAKRLGDIHVDVPIEAFTGGDFVDSGHFSAAGARKFAQHLTQSVRSSCP